MLITRNTCRLVDVSGHYHLWCVKSLCGFPKSSKPRLRTWKWRLPSKKWSVWRDTIGQRAGLKDGRLKLDLPGFPEDFWTFIIYISFIFRSYTDILFIQLCTYMFFTHVLFFCQSNSNYHIQKPEPTHWTCLWKLCWPGVWMAWSSGWSAGRGSVYRLDRFGRRGEGVLVPDFCSLEEPQSSTCIHFGRVAWLEESKFLCLWFRWIFTSHR